MNERDRIKAAEQRMAAVLWEHYPVTAAVIARSGVKNREVFKILDQIDNSANLTVFDPEDWDLLEAAYEGDFCNDFASELLRQYKAPSRQDLINWVTDRNNPLHPDQWEWILELLSTLEDAKLSLNNYEYGGLLTMIGFLTLLTEEKK